MIQTVDQKEDLKSQKEVQDLDTKFLHDKWPLEKKVGGTQLRASGFNCKGKANPFKSLATKKSIIKKPARSVTSFSYRSVLNSIN